MVRYDRRAKRVFQEMLMILRLTEDFTRVMEEHHGAPLRVVDASNHHYVLLPAEQFEKLEALFQQDEFDPGEVYPLIDEVMKEDWDDPAMDLYNDYDANRPQP
jgi:hypothetical protein